MKKLTFLIALGILSNSSFGQIDFDKEEFLKNIIGTIESDRPGQALNATTCGVLAFQIQTGFNYSKLVLPVEGSYRNQGVPTNIRLGLSNIWEINTNFSYLNQNFSNGIDSVSKSSGFPSPDIGIRCAFLKGNKWKPYLAIQANMSIPSQRGTYTQAKMGSSFFLVTSNRFDHISVNTTLGMTYSGNGGNTASYSYALNIGTMLSDKLGTFVEAFGSINRKSLALDGGFSFLATPNLQLDLFGGWLGNTSWFAEAGLSWRLSLFQNALKKNITNIESLLE